MNSTVYGVDEYGNEAEDVRSGYVGEIKMFGFSGVPAHCLACDGSLLSIAAYPELYAKLGTQHGGDGVTTFALPTAEDVIYAAGNGRAVGAAVVDGLPNIVGKFQLRNYRDTTSSGYIGAVSSEKGAFSLGTSSNLPFEDLLQFIVGDVGYQGVVIAFSAQSCNSIYGASTHVQPKGTAFNLCIVYE